MRWSGHGARMGEGRKACRILVGKPKGKRLRGRPSRRWDGRLGSEWIIGRFSGGVEWIQVAQHRYLWRALVNAVMNLRVLAPWS
jgi:hypothetical protein